MRPPWVVAGAVSQDPASYPYELYDLTKDWTQFDNVADKYPEKVKELKPLFWEEAEKYQVLPLDATVATRLAAPRPNLAAGRTEFTWPRATIRRRIGVFHRGARPETSHYRYRVCRCNR